MSHRASSLTALVALCAALAAAVGVVAPRPRVMVRERATGATVRLGSQRPDGALVILPPEGHLPATAQADESPDEATAGTARAVSRSLPAVQNRRVSSAPTDWVASLETAYSTPSTAGTARAPASDRAPPLA